MLVFANNEEISDSNIDYTIVNDHKTDNYFSIFQSLPFHTLRWRLLSNSFDSFRLFKNLSRSFLTRILDFSNFKGNSTIPNKFAKSKITPQHTISSLQSLVKPFYKQVYKLWCKAVYEVVHKEVYKGVCEPIFSKLKCFFFLVVNLYFLIFQRTLIFFRKT